METRKIFFIFETQIDNNNHISNLIKVDISYQNIQTTVNHHLISNQEYPTSKFQNFLTKGEM